MIVKTKPETSSAEISRTDIEHGVFDGHELVAQNTGTGDTYPIVFSGLRLDPMVARQLSVETGGLRHFHYPFSRDEREFVEEEAEHLAEVIVHSAGGDLTVKFTPHDEEESVEEEVEVDSEEPDNPTPNNDDEIVVED